MALLQEHRGEWFIIDFVDEEAVYVMDIDMVGQLICIISLRPMQLWSNEL